MATLSDHIDRLSLAVKSIRASASSIATTSPPAGGPFTQAVLSTALGDLIRDIDPSELGLFTLVPAAASNVPVGRDTDPAAANAQAEIARIDVVSATPLRKHPATRRDDILRPKEPEPEVYANAALKYLDRYASIRPMPRAQSQVTAILEQLHELRENIHSLNAALEQAKHAAPDQAPASPKTLANEEERRIQDARARISQLQKRKEVLQVKRKRPPIRTAASRPTPVADSPLTAKTDEDNFWNTPGAPARTLQFKNDMLLDEQVDLGDVTSSFASPVSAVVGKSSVFAAKDWTKDASPRERMLNEDEPEGNPNETATQDHAVENGDDEDVDAEEEDEKTVMFKKAPPAASTSVSPPAAPPDQSYASEVEIEPLDSAPARKSLDTDAETVPRTGTPPSASAPSRKPKVRITSEVERITTKIWSSVGEIIMPGHKFDVSGGSSNRPPRAKETIAHLQSLSSQTPAPPSPTASSLSSITVVAPSGQPSSQQILTAHMLLALLAEPPSFALPLNRLKETLNAKASGAGAQVTTRVVYGSVAKRLIKIERGGGEQVVRFDV